MAASTESTVSISHRLENYPVWHPEDRISVKYRFQDYTEPGDTTLSAIEEGKLLHEIFKSIKSISDINQAVRQAYLEGLINKGEEATYRAKILDYLNTPIASEWFAEDCSVITEKDILFPGGKKARPDRVIFKNGILQIIDYKFGQSEESKYLKQVRFYYNTLYKMGYKKSSLRFFNEKRDY